MKTLEQHPPVVTADRAITRAVESPLVRGGLMIVAGLLTGNILGFLRVAITAYLLGTHSAADALAVAIGPLDTLNSVLTNTMVFAFVPMLTERRGAERTALFFKLNRIFAWVFAVLTAAVVIAAPWVMRVLAPGLDAAYFPVAVEILRIGAFSSMAAGAAAIHSALLFTDRRFAPSAFYQASLNLFTIAGALSMWKVLGVYGFAVGYTFGAWAQFAVVYFCARRGLHRDSAAECDTPWRELIAKPGAILVYAVAIASNITVTRAYATHAGPGMAAALDYCMKCVGVPLAFLIMPVSNSLLPEIARLRSQLRLREAFRLIDKTTLIAAAAAVVACGVGLAVRGPVIARLFQRGSFTAESTRLVADVFLGLAPCLVGWTLLEITSRSLFSLDKPKLPLCAAAIPVLVNVVLAITLRSAEPRLIGLGASLGMLAAFLFLFLAARSRRRRWLLEV